VATNLLVGVGLVQTILWSVFRLFESGLVPLGLGVLVVLMVADSLSLGGCVV